MFAAILQGQLDTVATLAVAVDDGGDGHQVDDGLDSGRRGGGLEVHLHRPIRAEGSIHQHEAFADFRAEQIALLGEGQGGQLRGFPEAQFVSRKIPYGDDGLLALGGLGFGVGDR